MMIKIVGCGYIGKKVARKLMTDGYVTDCYVHSPQSKQACEALGLQASLIELDDVSVYTQWKSGNANSVVAYFAPPPGHGLIDTRMGNFLSLVDASNNLPSKIVLISTTGVYGDCQGEWIDETYAPNPQADRAHRRLNAEVQLQNFCETKNIECIIFRVPGIYAMDKLPVRRVSSGEPIVNVKDSGFTNRIHAEDLSNFCVEALTQKIKSGIYNCCDGNPSTMNAYFMRVAEVLNLQPPAEISLQQAREELSAGMLSYLAESKRISNNKLLESFTTKLKYPDLEAGLKKPN